MTYYDQINFHSPTSAPIDLHQIHERGNTMAYQWEYSETSTQIASSGNPLSTHDDVIKKIKDNPCNALNVDGEIGWRVPNQKEQTILLNNGITGDGYFVSCTQEYYMGDPDINRLMGANGGIMTAFSNSNHSNVNYVNKYVRCVRDIVNTSRDEDYKK